jgi:peptide deformylase
MGNGADLTTMLLKIVSVGEPVLRKQARPLTAEEIRSTYIQDLIAYMRETMHDAPGVGLAAPQVGQSLQLAVI